MATSYFVDFNIKGTGLTLHRCTNGPYTSEDEMWAEARRLYWTSHQGIVCRWEQPYNGEG